MLYPHNFETLYFLKNFKKEKQRKNCFIFSATAHDHILKFFFDYNCLGLKLLGSPSFIDLLKKKRQTKTNTKKP